LKEQQSTTGQDKKLTMRFEKSLFGCAVVFITAFFPMIPTTATADAHNIVFSVMTRNMDLGSDYAPALAATDTPSFLQGVTTIYNEIAASNIHRTRHWHS